MAQLEKARLHPLDGGKEVYFMFNPTELVFEGMVETSDNPGSRNQVRGTPKISFSHTKAYKVTINNILFDTYETGENVLEKHINFFREAVEFTQGKQRPPTYQLIWGSQVYLKSCFVEKLNYKLTMFLSDGRPVRATIDNLTLKEIEDDKPVQSLIPGKFSENMSNIRRAIDNIDGRRKSRNIRQTVDDFIDQSAQNVRDIRDRFRL